MTTPLTLDQAKDLVAKKYGYNSWVEAFWNTGARMSMLDEAFTICLDSQKRATWERACEAQREMIDIIVYEDLKPVIGTATHEGDFYLSNHVRTLIIKAPNAEYKEG